MQQIQIPPLAEGEIYLCGLVNATGDVTHTILLPTEAEKRMSWPDAMEWAKSLNADLPTRAELVIAFEQHRSQFKEAAYWSNTPDADPEYAGWACSQDFRSGYQYTAPSDRRVARPCRPQIDDLTLHSFSGEVSNDAHA